MTAVGAPVSRPLRLDPPPFGALGWAAAFFAMLLGAGGFQVFLAFDRGDLLVGLLAAFALAVGAAFLVRHLLRPTVTLHEHGFVVRRLGRVSGVRSEDVRGIHWSSAGSGDRLVNRFRADTPEGSLGFRYSIAAGAADPVREYAGAMIGWLADVAAGGAVAGDGWQVDRGVLATTAGHRLPLGEVAAHASLADGIAAWRRDESLPFLTVPFGSRNAWVLEALLRRHVVEEAGRVPQGLGRLLVERRVNWNAFAVRLVLFVPLVLLWLGVGLATNAIFSAVMAVLVGLLALSAFGIARQRLRVFEAGMQVRTAWGERTMLFSDVERFSYVPVRRYTNGVYAGTTLHVEVVPGHGAPLAYSTTYHDDGAAFEDLRDRLTAAVADRLWSRLTAEGRLAWLGGVTITFEGLVVERKKGMALHLPFGTFATSIHEGVFSLTGPALGEDAVSIPSGAMNFHPGLRVLLALADQAAVAS